MSRTVAILPWGDVMEDFLEPIGLDLHDFAHRMSDGWLFGYAAALESAGRRPVIVCASKRLSSARRLVHAATGTPIVAVPGRAVEHSVPWRRSVTQWRLTPFRSLRSVLRSEGVGAVLVQDYEHARFDAVAALTAALHLPLFATFQGGDVTASRIEAWARPWSLARTSGLAVASSRERARLAERYPRSLPPIADIPNPIDTGSWSATSRDEARAELGIADEVFLVISHGRIDIQRKGLDVLLDAWRRFAAGRPDRRLLLVGSGQDHEALRHLLDRAGLGNVSWHAEYMTDRLRLRRWLSAADAYVIASRVEGMPVAPLEAMAIGLPVVATAAHGLPEIFADGERSGGILVPSGDAVGVAAGLQRLVDSPRLRAELGCAARRRVEARFSIAAVGAALDELMRAGGA